MKIPHRSYYGIKIALNDNFTTVIYCLFILIADIIFTLELKKIINGQIVEQPNTYNLPKKINNKKTILIIHYICILTGLFLIFALLFAPNTSIYFDQLGYIDFNKDNLLDSELRYHEIVTNLEIIAILGVIISKTIDRSNSLFLKFLRIIIMIFITLADGKRTTIMMLVGICILIDFIKTKNKRRILNEIIIAVIVLGIYFVIYSIDSGKYYYNTNWYSTINEYFFRSETTRVAIYSMFNPNKLKILDYPLQTIIYNLFFYIPRSIWETKPFPYPVYYFSAVNGYSTLIIETWRFQTSYWAEFISNLGILGAPLSIYLTIKLTSYFDKKNIVIKLLGTGLICLLQIYEFSDTFKFLTIILILLILMDRFSYKEGIIKIVKRK
ncbi:MAG: O-antigen polymerase [Thomasclavelia sp.]